MKISLKVYGLISLLAFAFLIGLILGNLIVKKTVKKSFLGNDDFIEDLYNGLNLNDSKEVFRYVFSSLNEEITIYPTENYYYFTFPANGKLIWGSLSLSAHSRDQGILGFGYSAKIDKIEEPKYPVIGGGGTYTASDSVFVKKIDDFNYSVTFNGKNVLFKLNNIGLNPTKNAKLTIDEIFIGPSFDESGLKFFLIFNKSEHHLYWILNEDGFVPESFTSYTNDLVIGDRTRYAFYIDSENNRKILIGVEGFNVLQNNWYDGPFDQMPDNYVYNGQIEVQKYIEASYPDVEGRIDKYGNYTNGEGNRIAIAPYFVYFAKEDLLFVDYCKALNSSKSQLYSCITQQVYNVPEDIFY